MAGPLLPDGLGGRLPYAGAHAMQQTDAAEVKALVESGDDAQIVEQVHLRKEHRLAGHQDGAGSW